MLTSLPANHTTTTETDSPCNDRDDQHVGAEHTDMERATVDNHFAEDDESMCSDVSDELDDEDMVPTAETPYPGFEQTVFRCLPQTHRFRRFCLYLITSPYPFLTFL